MEAVRVTGATFTSMPRPRWSVDWTVRALRVSATYKQSAAQGTTFVGSLSILKRVATRNAQVGALRPEPPLWQRCSASLWPSSSSMWKGVAVLSEGNPGRVRQPWGQLRGSLFVAEGPCERGSAALRKCPRVLLGSASPCFSPRPSRWALTTVNSTHSTLQLGVTDGGAPGAIRVHVGTAPGSWGSPSCQLT